MVINNYEFSIKRTVDKFTLVVLLILRYQPLQAGWLKSAKLQISPGKSPASICHFSF